MPIAPRGTLLPQQVGVMTGQLHSEGVPRQIIPRDDGHTRGVIAWSSFFFALLQSICTFFLALSGVRLVIGVGSVVLSAGAAAALEKFHANWIRSPMVGLALLGSLLNLVVLIQIRNLRSRPASRWRQRPLSSKEVRMERVQWFLSFATLILIAIEEYLHWNRFQNL
jgi:hypothetical protein